MKIRKLTEQSIDLTAELHEVSDIFIPSKALCNWTSLEESQHTLPLYGQKTKDFLGITGAPTQWTRTISKRKQNFV